jgi:hypothetical protein
MCYILNYVLVHVGSVLAARRHEQLKIDVQGHLLYRGGPATRSGCASVL